MPGVESLRLAPLQTRPKSKSSERTGGRLSLMPTLDASDTPMKAALEPVEVFEGICERCCDVGSRLAVQPLWLDQPGTSSRIPKRAFKVPSGLGVVVGALPTGSVNFR
jgi:hypothetical protein